MINFFRCSGCINTVFSSCTSNESDAITKGLQSFCRLVLNKFEYVLLYLKCKLLSRHFFAQSYNMSFFVEYLDENSQSTFFCNSNLFLVKVQEIGLLNLYSLVSFKGLYLFLFKLICKQIVPGMQPLIAIFLAFLELKAKYFIFLALHIVGFLIFLLRVNLYSIAE